MAVAVVDLLQPVDVDDRQRDVVPGSPCSREGASEIGLERAAVGATGKRIGQGGFAEVRRNRLDRSE
jgi:hypothetical protein